MTHGDLFDDLLYRDHFGGYYGDDKRLSKEDEPVVREIVQELLAQYGYTDDHSRSKPYTQPYTQPHTVLEYRPLEEPAPTQTNPSDDFLSRISRQFGF